MQYLAKMKKEITFMRHLLFARREEAVGDRLIALVYVSMLLYVNLDAISFNYVRLALHFLFIQCIFLVTTGDLHLMPRV